MTNTQTDEFIVISALGQDKLGIVDKLSGAILEYHGNIIDSRMSIMGGEFAIMLMVSGKWNVITKIEDNITSLGESLGLQLITKRTTQQNPQANLLPYTVEGVCVDQPGIVHKVAGFFSAKNINIQSLSTEHYAAPHTGTPLFSLRMEIDIQNDISIPSLREEFLDFSDAMNFDAILEPRK